MNAKTKTPLGVKPNYADFADLPEHWDRRRVYRYCYYGEGHDGEKMDYWPAPKNLIQLV